jgi:hypothetical protein
VLMLCKTISQSSQTGTQIGTRLCLFSSDVTGAYLVQMLQVQSSLHLVSQGSIIKYITSPFQECYAGNKFFEPSKKKCFCCPSAYYTVTVLDQRESAVETIAKVSLL